MASSLTTNAAAGSWRDRWHGARDRLLSRQAFRRWASAFPLTRAIARRRSRQLFDLCAGFVYSQVLMACVRLGLFDHLARGPRTAAELSALLSIPVDATDRLLRAAAALDLVEIRGRERYGLGPLGAAMVDNPAVAAMVEHHAVLYTDLEDPVSLLKERGTRTSLSAYWPYATAADPASLEGEQVAAYTRLMSASSSLVAEELLDAYPLRAHRCLLDVGGGDGTFLARVARREPGLRLLLFDLPAVASRASARFATEGIAERARAVGGNFLEAALPEGADVATLLRVLHDHGDREALAILRAVHRALPPGGTLVVAEPMSGIPGAERATDAYFGFYLLAMGSGVPRSPERLAALLGEAGFDGTRRLPTRIPVAAQVLVSRKPVGDRPRV
jgi:demethylspheroidene O-methyltransferase